MKITRRQLRKIMLEMVAKETDYDEISELEGSEEAMSEMDVEDDARSAEGGDSFIESFRLSGDQIKMIIEEEIYLALKQENSSGDMYGGPSGIAVPYGDDLDEDDLDEISDSEQDAKITDLQLKLQSDTAAANKGGGNLARARMRGDQEALSKTQFA